MELRRLNDILAIKTPAGRVLGFHARHLEVARLSEESWDSMKNHDGEAWQELQNWNNSQKSVGSQAPSPHKIIVNVTQVCNLHCTYCAAGGDGTYGDPIKRIALEKAIPQIFSFLQRVPDGESFHINLIGGEPLLYPEGIRILVEATRAQARERQINVEVRVVTNGTLFSEKNLELLRDLRAHVTVSLDGPAAINDRRRPNLAGQGVTEKVIVGLHSLLAHKSDLASVGVHSVFDPEMSADVDGLYDFYAQFDLDWFDLAFDVKNPSQEASQAYTQTMGELARLAYTRGGEKALRKLSPFDHHFTTLDQQSPMQNFCQAGKTTFAIDAKNQVAICPWLAGRPKEIVGYGTELWQDRLIPYQEPLVEKNGCGQCWARSLCGGGCMYIHETHTGNKHQVDQKFCERTRQLATFALSYYELCRNQEEDNASLSI